MKINSHEGHETVFCHGNDSFFIPLPAIQLLLNCLYNPQSSNHLTDLSFNTYHMIFEDFLTQTGNLYYIVTDELMINNNEYVIFPANLTSVQINLQFPMQWGVPS